MLYKYIKFIISIFLSFYLVIIIAFSFVSASPDYNEYFKFYTIDIGNIGFFQQRLEPLYYIIVFISAQVMDISFTGFVFLCTFFSLFIKLSVAFFMNKDKLLNFCFLYACVSIIIFEVVGLRVSIAIAFLALGLFFYHKKLFLTFYLCLIVSVLLHYSMVLCIILMFMLRYKDGIRLKHFLFLFGLSFFVPSFVIYVLDYVNINPLLPLYLKDTENAPSLLSFYNILVLFVFFLGCFSYKNFSELAKIYFIISFGVFSVSISFYFAPVIYFRYIDVAMFLLIYTVISIRAKEISTIVFVLFFYLFAIYKFLSIMYFSPILNF